MKTLSLTATKADFGAALAKAAALKPQLVIVFAAPALLQDGKSFAENCAALPGAHVIGCSTAGEISGTGVADGGYALLALHFERTNVKTAQVRVASPEDSFSAGYTLGKSLAAPDLRGVFVLSPGLRVNGGALAKGVAEGAGSNVAVAGGMAGDGVDFRSTHTALDGKIYTDQAVAFGLYGDKVTIKSGSRGGWRPFGPARRVTRASSNVIYELDGKPALDVYREYLGDKAAGMPATGQSHPFSILREEDRKDTGVMRTVLGADQKEGSILLAGDVSQGTLVRLLHADVNALIDSAWAAGEAAAIKGLAGESAALLVSCVGRKAAMGDDAGEEVDAVLSALGKTPACAGFYSYGQFCQPAAAGMPELYNQAMTVIHIAEDAA